MTPQEIDRIENAIRHIESSLDVDPWAAEVAVEAMRRQIESVEPEIIRCRDCRFYIDHRCYESHSSIGDWRTENDFCSFAERRTDG